ncbi:MAG TPA: hypothetical protein VGJ20_09275 [Xanthobacteraceae bacterium]
MADAAHKPNTAASRLFAQYLPPVLLAQLIADTYLRQLDQFGEWRVRPA